MKEQPDYESNFQESQQVKTH